MSVTIEKVGSRLYFGGNTFPIKDRIKNIGGHWDGDRRAWWVGVAKAAAAEKLIASLESPLATPSAASVTHASTVGLRPDAPAAMVADKLEEEGHTRAAAAVREPKQDPSDIRLTGKGEYKGRTYYVGSSTRDGKRVRLLTLPDANGDFLDFWAAVAEVQITKTYSPREVRRGYRGHTTTEYTTLGSIARFIARQRRQEESGVHSACGRRDCRRLSGEFCTDCHDEE